MISNLTSILSGEFFLRNRPNGGTAVFLRSLFVTALIYALAIALKSYTAKNAVLSFSLDQLRQEISDTIPWLGAIFAASYAAFYSRFSAQWSYLATLYNQIMATCVALGAEGRETNQTLITWQAAFIEDAEDLHLATKPMFATVILQMLQEPHIRNVFMESTAGGQARLERLESRIVLAIGGG